MTRPTITLNTITGTLENWDAAMSGNDQELKGKTFDGPFPIKEYATFGDLPAASSYDRCIAAVTATSLIYISDGSNWKPIGTQCANQANSVAATVGALVTDFNALLAKLQASGIMA